MLLAFLKVAFAFILLILVFFVAERHNKRRRYLRIIVSLCIIAASSCVSWLAVQALPPEYEPVRILATRRQNKKAKENSLYLTGVYQRDRAMTILADEEAYWNLSGNWYVWRESEADAAEPLSTDSFCFNIPTGRQRSLEFFTNASKGVVQIQFQRETWDVDCYSESDGRIRVDLSDTPTEQLVRQLRQSVFTFLVAFVLCSVLLIFFWFGLCWLYDRTGKARLHYEEFWRTLSGWRGFLFYTVHYSALFGVLCVLVFLPFIKAGKTFLWVIDAVPSYLPSMIRTAQRFQRGASSLLHGSNWPSSDYDFCSGLIKRAVTFAPSQLLLFFWREDRIDQYYQFLILLRLYCAGLALSTAGLYFKKKPLPVLIGAVSYSFCNFSLYFCIRHPGFSGPMVLMPLLLIGVEKLVRKERPYLFVILVVLALLYSPYYGGMLAVLTVIYAPIRWFTLESKPSAKETAFFFLRFFANGLLGVLISGMVLVPYLITIFGTSRIGQSVASEMSGAQAANLLKTYFVFPAAYYKKFLSAFLIAPGHTYYSLCLGFSALSLPALVFLFYGKKPSFRTQRAAFIAVTLLALSPLAAYVLSGFSTYSHRWSHAYALVLSFVLMTVLPEMTTENRKRDNTALLVILLYGIVCCVLGASYRKTALPGILLLLMGTAVFFASKMLGARQAMCAALIVSCVSCCLTAFLLFDPGQRNYVSEFVDKGKVYQYYNESIYGVFSGSKSANDTMFYRVSGSGITPQSLGVASLYDVNGLTYHDSYYFQSYAAWVNGMETVTMDEQHHHYGPGNRLGVLSIAGVKYYVWRDSDREVMPYGFEKTERLTDEVGDRWILENQFWLPLGFTTETYISSEEYESLNAIERQEVQLQAAALEPVPADAFRYTHLDFAATAQTIPYQIIESRGIRWEGESLQVTRQNATMKLRFEGQAGCETYLRIVGLDLTGEGSSENWVLTAQSINGNASTHLYSDEFLYASKIHNQVLNLGYSETGVKECTITFPDRGSYHLVALEIWCLPTEHYAEQIAAFRKDTLNVREWGGDRLKGEINVEGDKLLLITLPYDEAWSAYVDGAKTKIYRADEAWIAIELEKGSHVVELSYHRPGLTAGLAVSAIGVLLLILLICLEIRRKKDPTRQGTDSGISA